jgi:hypothetical protein
MNLEVASVIALTLIGGIGFRIFSNRKIGRKEKKAAKMNLPPDTYTLW